VFGVEQRHGDIPTPSGAGIVCLTASDYGFRPYGMISQFSYDSLYLKERVSNVFAATETRPWDAGSPCTRAETCGAEAGGTYRKPHSNGKSISFHTCCRKGSRCNLCDVIAAAAARLSLKSPNKPAPAPASRPQHLFHTRRDRHGRPGLAPGRTRVACDRLHAGAAALPPAGYACGAAGRTARRGRRRLPPGKQR
jgi:hypothetical protein